eukprot:165213_1
MAGIPIQILCAFIVAFIIFINYELDDDEEDYDMVEQRTPPPQGIGKVPPRDIYSEIYGTVWMKHHTGVNERLFDYIDHHLNERLYEPRNNDGEYDAWYNKYVRRRRACKISNRNRIINFLHQMRSGEILWDSSLEHQWCLYSCGVDFFHCLLHFVNTFDQEWIRNMSDNEIHASLGLFDGYQHAYQALDEQQSSFYEVDCC